MRIIHVINSLSTGGAEQMLAVICREMKALGHDVEIIVLKQTASALTKKLENERIPIHHIGSRVYSPFNIWKLRKFLKNADVAHVHLFPSQYWAALAAFHLQGAPKILVTTEHSTFNNRCKHRLTSWLDRLVYSRYDGIAGISEATVEFIRKRLGEKNTHTQIRLVQNGVDLDKFCDVKAERSQLFPFLHDSDFVLIQVARFSDQKNQSCVVRAMAELPEHTHLLFVGDGPMRQANETLSKQLHLENRIHFLGMRSDVAQCIAVSDAGIMSSNWEGFGLAAVEVMAEGKPILASDVPGLSEVVEDKDLLFVPDDESNLAEKILKLCKDYDYRKKKGKECKLRAAKYGVDKTVRNYINFYQELKEQSDR